MNAYFQELVDHLVATEEEFRCLKEDGVQIKVFYDYASKKHCHVEPTAVVGMLNNVKEIVMGIFIPELFKMLVGGSKHVEQYFYNCFYHELIHVKQFYTGELVIDSNRNVHYNGKSYTFDDIHHKYLKGKDYSEFGWEVVAYEKANKTYPLPNSFMLFFASQKTIIKNAFKDSKQGKKFDIQFDKYLAYVHNNTSNVEDYIEYLRKEVTTKHTV